MRLVCLLLAVVVSVSACGNGPDTDVVASIQLDEGHDVLVVRVEETDLTPSLAVCRVPHGSRKAPDVDRCAAVDPWYWTIRSVAAVLDPGPASSLLVVTDARARFVLADPSPLALGPPVQLNLPTGPIGSIAPLGLKVAVAESTLSAEAAVGCLTTEMGGSNANPVFITATVGDTAETAAVVPSDLQTACL